MKSYLLSALAARLSTQGKEVFRAQHDHDWLVWEAGAWKPPNRQTVAVSRQQLKVRVEGRASESLAIALEALPQGLKLGRAHEADLIINDGTLSGHHLTLKQLPDRTWTVEDAHSKNGTRLDGDQLAPGVPGQLRDGDHIDAAHVTLTYYTAEGILRRLAGVPVPST